MKEHIKCTLLAMITCILQCIYYFRYNESVSLEKIIHIIGFGEIDFYIISIVLAFFKYIPILIFQICYGTYIYKHFCSASVYRFSRFNNRIEWFLKEALKLFYYCVFYAVATVLVCVGFFAVFFGVTITESEIFLAFYYVVIYSLWYFITSLLINLLSIILTSVNSFSIVSAMQFLAILALNIFDVIRPFYDNPELNSALLKINPISHLVMGWHSSKNESVNSLINYLGIDFSVIFSVMYYIMLSVVLLISGCFMIKRKDIILSNKETGGL